MASSVKVNYIFNLINTVSKLLFPLITFPYVSRIMLADGIGHVNFYHSIISYITLLTCLGIPMYAIKEIAKVRDDSRERNRVAMEILLLNAVLLIFGYGLVALVAEFVPEVHSDIPLFLLLSMEILFTVIGCEWFYQGIEDFKYVTIRGLVVKVISVCLLFVLVRSRSDLYWYAFYTIMGSVGGNIFNFIRLRKYISFRKLEFRSLKPFNHLLPALHIFALNLIISIYAYLNSIMLGILSDDTAVGLFTAASKLSHILLGIGNALGTAMLPRMSNLIAQGKLDEFKSKSSKSMRFMVGITLPITIGLIFVAPFLINLFSGPTYQPAVLTLQIIAPIVLLISMSNVTGIQILYPMGKVNLVIATTALGALTNLALNLYLIPRYQQDGAAVSTVFAELAVTASMLIVGRKYFAFNFISKSYLCYIVGGLLMGLTLWALPKLPFNDFVNLLIYAAAGATVYIGVLSLCKEQIMTEITGLVVAHIHKVLKRKG